MDQKVIANLRSLSIDMINEAKSGHPGISLSAAPLIYTIYANYLKFNPKDPMWINRDRFIMSPGHGSALLYSTLFLSGYNISFNDLKSYRKINSKLTGHPKYNPSIVLN
jgi:transketolase